MAAKKPIKAANLIIRNATHEDIPEIQKLIARCYPGMPPYKAGHLRGQIHAFPDGVFVAVSKKRIVGYCASFLVDERLAFSDHSWAEITGGGYNSRHNPNGDWLYGMEVCVDPDFRGLRVGQRFYNARKELIEEWRLKGIVIVGRMPQFAKNVSKYPTARSYVKAIKDGALRDPVLGFQVRNGFQMKKVIRNYLMSDRESGGNACLLSWSNPSVTDIIKTNEVKLTTTTKSSVRVTTVQYQQRRIRSFSEFLQIIEYFVDVAADYRSDFVVFPEWFTLQLISAEKKPLGVKDSIYKLAEYTERFKDEMHKLAVKYNINIIGGSTAHRAKKDGPIQNVSFVFLRDGSIYSQAKLHPTPNEKYWWDLKPGNDLQAIPTDCGLIGVLICYDSEFPELSRHLVDQGMKILFVPFCTDERQSYLRVRYCCQARAVENQIYVVMSGNVGNLPRVENMDIQYAQSCILSPCDFPFSRDGIGADTTPNVETVAVADLHLDSLSEARNGGTVRQLKDRRHDLYQLVWKEPTN